MASRLELHNKLTAMFSNIDVYYQPPSRLNYPCLLYELDGIDTNKADDKKYLKKRRYLLTYMSKTPDPVVTLNNETKLVDDILLDLKYCKFDRVFKSDNVYHYTYSLYY